MKTTFSFLYFISFVLLFYSCNSPTTTVKESIPVSDVQTLDEQLSEIMKIWPGTFNNDKQIALVEADGKDVWRVDDSGKDGYLQLQSHYIKIDNPSLGENALYVEEYRDHSPEETYRQRIYLLSVQDSTKTLRVKMCPFKDKKKFIGAWKNPEVLNDLSLEDISPFPDKCDMLVSKKDGKYFMAMNGKDCSFGDKCFNYQVVLSPDLFSYRDKITDVKSDSIISTAANFVYHDLDRIK